MGTFIKLPLEKCMKCAVESYVLLNSHAGFAGVDGQCIHKFCQSCFRNENANHSTSKFTCPCCYTVFYENINSIDEAIIIGKALTMRFHLSPLLLLPRGTVITAEDLIYINELNKEVIRSLEALQLNLMNLFVLYLLVLSCYNGYTFLIEHKQLNCPAEFYRVKQYYYTHQLLDLPTVSGQYDQVIRGECCFHLAHIFTVHHNYPSALKYSKLAYEHCLRSSDHTNLSLCKDCYLELRAAFAALPSLRFAIGDEVEFLHELETGSEWRLGKVVELYCREQDFPIKFTAPYRLKLLGDSADQSPVYACVNADIDRYIRKVGVMSIEDTRYQARLDAKVAELTKVYCSKEFIQDIYRQLAQDHEFVDMLHSVWQIELSASMLSLYRLLVMYREPLIRTVAGYVMPSSEEVIAGINAFFDSSGLSSDTATSAVVTNNNSQRIKSDIVGILQGYRSCSVKNIDDLDVQGLLLQSIRSYIKVLSESVPSGSYVHLLDQGRDFTIPTDLADDISKASTLIHLSRIGSHNTRLLHYRDAWVGLYRCLNNPTFEPACECPFVYFFVKYCLDQSLGVPKLALAVYDRMNMQLSREFIRCANPSCNLNKLDKSTGKIKFKQCSRCHVVIYCSRECQTAHYPEHKRLCREHSSTG